MKRCAPAAAALAPSGDDGAATTGEAERQVAELHIRVAVLNRFTALGTPVTQRVA